jgi:hypothetical protein
LFAECAWPRGAYGWMRFRGTHPRNGRRCAGVMTRPAECCVTIRLHRLMDSVGPAKSHGDNQDFS